MTSRLLDTVNGVLAQLGEIPFQWRAVPGAEKNRPDKLFQLVRMWNDQVSRVKDGSGYLFAAPACFPELIFGETTQMLENVTNTDVTWRLHIADMQLDAGNDVDMDQNLTVILARDMVKAAMVGYQPPNCSTLFYIDERQDTTHTDLYHYTVDMKCCFTDTKGSTLDPDQTKVRFSTPPTKLELSTGISEDGVTPPVDPMVNTWSYNAIGVVVVEIVDPENTQDLGNGAIIPVEYLLNEDGSITVPYLASVVGIALRGDTVILNDVEVDTVTLVEGVFRNGETSFDVGDVLIFDADIPSAIVP